MHRRKVSFRKAACSGCAFESSRLPNIQNPLFRYSQPIKDLENSAGAKHEITRPTKYARWMRQNSRQSNSPQCSAYRTGFGSVRVSNVSGHRRRNAQSERWHHRLGSMSTSGSSPMPDQKTVSRRVTRSLRRQHPGSGCHLRRSTTAWQQQRRVEGDVQYGAIWWLAAYLRHSRAAVR